MEERAGSSGGVIAAGVGEERLKPGRRVVPAGAVEEERLRPGRGVAAAGGVIGERTRARGGIVICGAGVLKGGKTDCCVVHSAAQTKKRVGALGGIVVWITSVRKWENRSSVRDDGARRQRNAEND